MIEPLNAVVLYLVFLFSTVLHEAAHAWSAMRGGDLTAYHGGQVSLDPRPHIRREPFGMVLLPLLSLAASGWISPAVALGILGLLLLLRG